MEFPQGFLSLKAKLNDYFEAPLPGKDAKQSHNLITEMELAMDVLSELAAALDFVDRRMSPQDDHIAECSVAVERALKRFREWS